jgi:hypothetical protein
MPITLRYENVPHFCFSCGRIGHVVLSCEEEENVDQGVRFGEELRPSPPKRVRDISVKPMASRVARPLFQVPGMSGSCRSYNPKGQQGRSRLEADQKNDDQTWEGGMEPQKDSAGQGGKNVLPTQGMCNSGEASRTEQGSRGRERVSFRINMST